MATPASPSWRTGKICYLEIPATDVDRSAEFYRRAFGWEIRQRGDGATAFDDTVNQVSGTWVPGRPPASEPGLLVYIMVADAAAAVSGVVAAGGEIVRPVDPEDHEVFAHFRDPAGNVLGIYQQPGLAEAEGTTSGTGT
jgi:predicted enzyme related to lactoylglutathione lyase